MISGLENKEIDSNIFAKKIIENPSLINQYLEGLLSKNENYRYNCFKVLNIISEEKPELLYPHWSFFEKHLRSDNQYHKMSAAILIANLTAVDIDGKFERLFDEYYSILKSEKTVTPIYTIKYSGKIVNFKPHLEKKITNILVNIDNIHPGKQIELVKSAVIESFSDYFHKAENKAEIIDFVKKQLNSSSPKTKKTAKKFLERWGDVD
jgi:hypothetical protein